MGRVMIVFLLRAVILMTMLLQPVKASDGDVDYSSPYITVDPQTGQLVTRNPGPHLKNHSMNMSGQTTADTPTTVASTVANAGPATVTPTNQTTVDDGSSLGTPAIAIIVAGLFIFGTLAARKMRQKQ